LVLPKDGPRKVCAHQREILSEDVIYFVLVLNNRVYAQIMIGECVVRSFYWNKSYVAKVNASSFDYGLIKN